MAVGGWTPLTATAVIKS